MVPLCFRRSRILMIKVWREVMRAANAIISRKEMQYSQKLKLKLLVLILSMYCWRSGCDESPRCSNDKFNCGSIAYISYPFWGGTRSRDCGREGFQIICDANTPTLTISSLSYRLHQLDFATNSLTLSRQDLFDTACPNLLLLRNTTIDTELFRFPPNSTQLNLNLYYGCTGAPAAPANRLRCGDETVINLFSVGDAGPGAAGIGISCNSSIYVPINSKDAESLKNPSDTSINIVISALNAGFSIHWLNDSKQLAANAGGSCTGSKDKIMSVNRRLLAYVSDPNKIPSNRASGSGHPEDPGSKTGDGSGSTTVPVSSSTISPMPPPPATSPAANAPQPRYGLAPVPTPSSSHPNINYSRNPHGKKRGKEIIVIVLVAITAAAIIIISISIHYFLKRRQSAGSGLINPNSKQVVENFLLKHGSLAPRRYKFIELKKITRSFCDKLGEGGYGSVYKGKLDDGRPVAVKVLAEVNNSSSTGEDFMNEVASISRTSHVNIVTLLGFCSERNRRALVYEFMPNSSLDKFLNHNQSALDFYKIAVGIAKGLEYLHTGCTTRIVHFDIKPQNILLDEDFCPKISDFGLAKLCKKKQSILSVVGTRGTPGYIAPEVFSRNFGGVSHKSDVYSYGMLLLEMVGARKVAEAEANQSSEDYFPDKIYEQVIIDVARILDGLMIEEEEEVRRKMSLVGFWCMQTDPLTRPSISKVVEMLEGGISSIPIPPKPILHVHPAQPLPPSTNSTQNSSDHD